MERKTKVIFDVPAIGMRPVHTKEISGDTVVCFAVNNVVASMEDKGMPVELEVAYIGIGIPDPILGEIMGNLASAIIEKMASNKTAASFAMHEMAEILESRSKAIMKNMTEREMASDFSDAMLQLLGNLLKK